MSIDLSQFSEIFFDEAEELLADLEKLMLIVNTDEPDPEDINAIFRIAHSIKGGAATFGFTDLTEITHVLESMLDRIRQGEDTFTSKHQEILLQSRDVLKMQLDGLRFKTAVDQDKVDEIRKVLEEMTGNSHATPVSVPDPTPVVDTSSPAVPTKADKKPTNKQFRVEIPEMSENSLRALIEELALLGNLDSNEKQGNKTVLVLSTSDTPDDILALCSFTLDPDAVKVTEVKAAEVVVAVPESPVKTSPALVEDGSFGFFDDAPATPVAEITNKTETKSTEPAKVVVEKAEVEPAKPRKFEEETAEKTSKIAETKPTRSVEHNASADTKAARPKPASAERNNNSIESSTIRVSVEKVDQLINLVGELVITHAMIAKRSEGVDHVLHEKLLNGIIQLGQNSRDLQEAAMSMRMMPMEVVFSRFPRMVRELSGKLGKQINLITQGNSIELDKGLIEKIVDPLTHLVRNSIDHGIEKPDARAEKGKPEAGRLVLSAVHQGGNVVIEVTDDGNGLNREKILKKAISEGIPVKDNMPDEEVWQLIFAPGFSTADAVTDVSGRGVGMDVVKRNIINLGGTVNVQSLPGVGTTVTVSLPLTLAILDGMSFKVGDETYILPLNYVVESFQPSADNIKEMGNQGNVIFVRGEYLPIIPLHEVFNIEAKHKDLLTGILVVIVSEERKAALLVDELLGQQQIVVKNIESNYRRVPNISGATIMGDGSVSLIIDVSDMLRGHYTKTSIAAVA